MTAVKNENSYVSLAEADAYFALGNRINVDAWLDAADIDKNGALVTATGVIDESRWAGQAVRDTQPLAWPRIAQIFDPRLGRTRRFTAAQTDAPLEVREATYELAYHFIQNANVLDNPATATGSVDNIRVGSIALEGLRGTTISGQPVLPFRIRRLYAKFLVNGGNDIWYRAN